MLQDKQLSHVRLEDVLEKRRLDQALNAKEFAVLAGIAYSTARDWFRVPGFPVFRGVVFWQDFVQWRNAQNGLISLNHRQVQQTTEGLGQQVCSLREKLSPRAEQLLAEAG